LRSSGQISDFPLGTQEVCDRILIPQKLYGREREVETLLQAFERVTTGQSEFLLVAGYSGIGKSSLVQEIYKPITAKRGYFISGKFDQYQRNIPYSAIIQAFKELLKQLLTETDAQLAEWKEKILSAVGANGRVIIEIIPEVELIIGEQPSLLDLAPAEAQKRFNFIFQDFIKVFTEPAHPLAIFLDDLQWADGASLKLIELLLTSSDVGLLLIGAYRDNEVNAAHPLRLSLANLQKEWVKIQGILLNSLELETVNSWLADTLKASHETTQNLAELVQAKTGGNPFFITEFMQALYTENLLNFDYGQQRWSWDTKQVQKRNFTDNVVELMVAKIHQFPPETQEVLKLAACIGNQFELETIAIISETSARETALNLQNAVAEGLIQPLGNEYKSFLLEPLENEKNQAGQLKVEYQFIHDRIQQAAYSLIPNELKQRVHLQIGQLLLQNTTESQTDEKIFDIVNQLNHGSELVNNQQQREKIANLNLIAGQKAKSSTAYQPALMYLQQGLVWLGRDGWQTQYETAQALSVEAAEAAYLCGQFEEMESLVVVVLQKANRVLDQVRAYEVKIQACIATKKYQEAIETGVAILKLLGVRLPKNPSKLDVVLGMLKTKLLLRGKQIENLLALPEITDPYKLAAMRILSSISSAAYLAVPELLPLIVFKMVNLSVKHGNTSVSAYGYAGYGLIMCGVVGDIDFGYQLGQVALSLLPRLNVKERKARTLFVVNSFIRHWQEHVKETLQSLLEAYSSGLETGDLEFAAYSAHHYSYHSYFIGTKLEHIEREMSIYDDTIAQFKQETPLYLNKIYRQAVLNLMGRSEHPCCLTGESYNEEKKLPLHLTINDKYRSCHLYLNKLILCYIFENYSQALETLVIAEQLLLDGATGLFVVPIFYFYNSLTNIAVFSNFNKLQQKRILKKVAANPKKMKRWAEHAPMNYLHKFYLVEAERYQVLGQENQAMDYYDRAIA
jgi:predicted ATPase